MYTTATGDEIRTLLRAHLIRARGHYIFLAVSPQTRDFNNRERKKQSKKKNKHNNMWYDLVDIIMIRVCENIYLFILSVFFF
jgi:hypothetical protein